MEVVPLIYLERPRTNHHKEEMMSERKTNAQLHSREDELNAAIDGVGAGDDIFVMPLMLSLFDPPQDAVEAGIRNEVDYYSLVTPVGEDGCSEVDCGCRIECGDNYDGDVEHYDACRKMGGTELSLHKIITADGRQPRKMFR